MRGIGNWRRGFAVVRREIFWEEEEISLEDSCCRVGAVSRREVRRIVGIGRLGGRSGRNGMGRKEAVEIGSNM